MCKNEIAIALKFVYVSIWFVLFFFSEERIPFTTNGMGMYS